MRGLVSGSLDYIRNGDDTEELYGLNADPAKRANLLDDPKWKRDLKRLRATALDRPGA